MNAETFFTDEEQERIRQAVITAEKHTAGEIVPMLVSSLRALRRGGAFRSCYRACSRHFGRIHLA